MDIDTGINHGINQRVKPVTTKRDCELFIGGCSLKHLAERYKTPLYVIDEKSLKINFEKHQDIICGLEIVCPPLLISYGVNTYISEFKKNLDDGLAELTKTAKTVEDKK